MRFSTLELAAFGHFSGQVLRFGARTGAINIVYGDNEAGKSTSLRAVTSFLYGIPVRTTDDFVHQKPTLRIGAEIVAADGAQMLLYRRKGSKDTLRDAGDAPASEEPLARMLAGLDRELFEQMYALSRDVLAAGAQDLLRGSGSLGEALFGASLGLGGINEVVKELEDEAAQIFKAGGSVPVLNTALRELDEQRRQARELELRPADYLAHESALECALNERAALDVELRGEGAELRRLERHKQLLPLAALRAQVLGDIDALGEVVILAETAREERLAAKRDHDRATSDIDRAERAMSTLREQLELLTPNAELLARGDEVRALHSEIGAHLKAARDLPGLRTSVRNTTAEAATLLAQTHPGRTLDEVAELRPTVALRTTITALGEEYIRLTEATRAASKKLRGSQTDLAEAQRVEAELPALPDAAQGRAALAAARRLGEIEASLADEEVEYQAADAQLHVDMEELPLWDDTVARLEALPVPGIETMARFVQRYDQLAELERRKDEDHARIQAQLAAHQERLRALDLTGAVPSEADLTAARERRDFGWTFVRRTLESDSAVDWSEFAAERPLADAYETSVRAVDDVADRLRREADRVAQNAELEAGIASCEHELSELETRERQLGGRSDELADQWTAVWAESGITPLPPVEMQAWIETRAVLVAEAASQRKARARLDRQRATVRDHQATLLRELRALGCNVGVDLSLAALIERLEAALEEHAAQAALAKEVGARVATLGREEREARAESEAAASDLEQWVVRWAAATEQLEIASEMRPDEVREVVAALGELFVKLDTAAGFEQRVRAIERDADAFASSAHDLANAIAAELVPLPPEQIVTQLQRLLDAAQADATKANELTKQLEEKSEALRNANESSETAKAELERLMKAAGCKTMDELERAESRSATAIALGERLRAVEGQMVERGAAPAEALATELQGVELADVEASIQHQARVLEDLQQRRSQLDESVGRERALLQEMRGDDEAAEAVAAGEATKAKISEQAREHARLRIATALLRAQIDKFREESHGPLLDRASYFFSKLTCGESTGLGHGFDDRGNVVLLGRRKNGAEVTVEQMSDGTRDQLYLALRLAALEQQVERTEPLPLIVDDLFINFDDHRAAAGFEVLAEIARKTQVIFFTHHRHLVELAEKTLPHERWTLQELGQRAGVIEAAA
jgi:uncharacterized protein YhaN